MSVDFETKCEQHALDYIKIHLREGYFVNAFVDKGTYYWEKVYKIHAYKKDERLERDCDKGPDCLFEPKESE